MKKQTPPAPPETPPASPYQQLGYLRILRGSILLACVKYRGVELLLSSGLSLAIVRAEINRLGFQSNQLFADCLELGASFPTLRFAIHILRDPKPLWADSWNDSNSPPVLPSRPTAAPEPDDDGGDTQPPAQPSVQVLLPLEPRNLPPYPRGGGPGYGGR